MPSTANPGKVGFAWCVGGWAAFVATPVLAADKACFDAASEGQTLRDEHKLVEARDQFGRCAQAQCPTSMRADCAAWLEEVNTSIPTVVLTATDANGASVFDVRVHVDGQPLVDHLDGLAVPVNPGVSRFRFERADGASIDRLVQVNEGDKHRKIAAVFVDEPPSSQGPSRLGAGNVLGLAVGGAGLGGIVTGGVFGVVYLSEASKLRSECTTSAPCSAAAFSRAQRDESTAAYDGNVATAALVVGATLVLGGGALFILSDRSQRRAVTPRWTIVPGAGRSGGWLSLRGEF